MLKNNLKAFTLVELIVVITVLAVLSTIWFVSYSSYLVWVRDTNRIANIKSMSDWLELYKTKGNLPTPEDNVEVRVNGTQIAWQWYVWADTLESIEFSNWWKDPKDDTYYSYYLTTDKKYFQLMAFLESSENLQTYSPILNRAAAVVDYSDRYPTVYWKKMWIITDSSNTPLQEVASVVSAWYLDIDGDTSDSWGTYNLHFSDSYELSWTWSELFSISPDASCNRIKEIRWRSTDGIYSINPIWTWSINVYCDMTTDWGWWTMVARSVASSADDFGWNESLWSASIDTAAYSMWNDSDNINFTEVMAATYTSWKVIDTAYTLTVDSDDLVDNWWSSVDATSTNQVAWTTSPTSDFNKWWKFTNITWYWFSDNTTDKSLDSDWFTAWVFSWEQWMVFIR